MTSSAYEQTVDVETPELVVLTYSVAGIGSRALAAITDLLICGESVGASKTGKAEKLGVEVVDQADVWKLLIDAGIA